MPTITPNATDYLLGSPCTSGPPLIDFGGGAPILNYNLPQTTCFSGEVKFLMNIPEEFFSMPAKTAPEVNVFDLIKTVLPENLVSNLDKLAVNANIGSPSMISQLQTNVKVNPETLMPIIPSNLSLPEGMKAAIYTAQMQKAQKPASAEEVLAAYQLSSMMAGVKDKVSIVAGVSFDKIASASQKAALPVGVAGLASKTSIKMVPKPKKPKPKIYIVERHRICSYLGDYGAGKTLKTFSLLPGERTTITMRSFKSSIENKERSQNVLDSFSESSAQELESMVAQQQGYSAAEQRADMEQSSEGTNQLQSNSIDKSSSSAMTETDNFYLDGSVSASGGVNLGLFSVGADISVNSGYSTGTTTTNNQSTSSNDFYSMQTAKNVARSTNSARNAAVNHVSNALDKSVSRSNSAREIEIKTDEKVSTTTVTEEETTIVRELQNINLSRTLNFVFRQLIQEYVTVQYLEDVFVFFTNGYPESNRFVPIADLEELLAVVIPDTTNRDKVRNLILNQVSSVRDYLGAKHSMIERVQDEVVDFTTGNVVHTVEYYQKKTNLSQSWSGLSAGASTMRITVPGIILSVKSRILRTDSVIVDAILGQGEALDCYNKKMQENSVYAAAVANGKSVLENQKIQTALKRIDDIPNSKQAIEAYNQAFNFCCQTPCCCGGCGGNHTNTETDNNG